MSAISDGSLLSLLADIRRDPDRYPHGNVLARKLAPIVEAMANEDSCAHSKTVFVELNKRKHAIGSLLFNLCYYPDNLYKHLMTQHTCDSLDCVNPRHRKRRFEEKRKKIQGVTEADLRRVYPMCSADLKAAESGKKNKINESQ